MFPVTKYVSPRSYIISESKEICLDGVYLAKEIVDKIIQILLQNMIRCFKSLERQYPKNIKLDELIVNLFKSFLLPFLAIIPPILLKLFLYHNFHLDFQL